MHHKFVVRDGDAVWSGSTNWTDDSWSRQENVIVTVGSSGIAYAYTLAFGQLWESGLVAHSGRVDPRPEEVGAARVRAWFCPEHGEALSHRVAKNIGKAHERVRIASPVLSSGPILATLVEVVNEGRCDVAGVVDDTQVDEVFGQWRTNGVSEWKVPLLQRVLEVADLLARLHAREGRRRRRHDLRRKLQLLALGRAERRERARDPGCGRRGRAGPVRRRRPCPLPARNRSRLIE
jgi:phosphatidylserine/phosphatidylglycerophosphate/cardiolipin synthase-like enzyme